MPNQTAFTYTYQRLFLSGASVSSFRKNKNYKKRGLQLLDIQHQPFEILTFRMINIDGMIGRLRELM